MSIVNTLARTGHLEEFGRPLVTNSGVKTPEQRKTLALQNLHGGFTTSAGTLTTAATSSVAHYMDPAGLRTSVFTFTNFSLGNGGDAAALAIRAKFFDFPAGNIWFRRASLSGSFTSTGLYTNALDVGIGSVIGSGVQSVLSGVGATSEDFIGSLTSAVLPTATVAGVTGTAAAAGIGDRMIATASAHTVHLNAAGTWTDIAAAAPVLFTGSAILEWKLL